MTPTLEPSQIPPRIQLQLEALARIRQDHPALLAGASGLRFGDTRLVIIWSKHCATQDEMQALALKYPETIWRPCQSARGSHDLDWNGVVAGVGVELCCVISLPLERLPERVTLEELRQKQQTTNTI